MTKYRFYKDPDNNWYIDLPEWPGQKAELQMVCGADTMLEYMAEGNDIVFVYISEREFQGCDTLVMLPEVLPSGAYYLMQTMRGIEINLQMWLCDVTKFVFGKFPEKLYLSYSLT